MDIEQIRQALEASGLRCTPQRYAVMEFLIGHKQHPTAVEIFEAVNRLDPRSSRATTYNNLRDLVEAGLVREVAAEGRAARFDATGLPHNHFICDQCGSVEDIAWSAVARPAPGALGKRVLRDCELILRGLCPLCAGQSRALKGRREEAVPAKAMAPVTVATPPRSLTPPKLTAGPRPVSDNFEARQR